MESRNLEFDSILNGYSAIKYKTAIKNDRYAVRCQTSSET